VEHWLNAIEMGRAAAESLLAGRGAAEPFTPMPRFWTEQYGIRIQAAGMPKLGKDIITLGTPDEGTGTVYGYSKEGRLFGVVGLDCPSSVLAWTDSVSRQNPAPRPRTPAEPAPAVSVGGGGGAKRGKGRHQLPPKDKKPQREEKREHEIAFVEEPPSEVGVGVGAGPVPTGRPKNVVDSFSRMLPVKVRPPGAAAGPPPGAPVPPPPGTPLPPPGTPVPVAPPGTRANGAPVPPPPGTPLPPPVKGVPKNGAPVNGAHVSGTHVAPPVNGAAVPPPGTPVNGRPVPPFAGAPRNGRPASGRFPVPPEADRVAPPQFRAANGLPEPLAGRLTAGDSLAIDVTGQMALLDANGHVRPPEFHDPMAASATMVEGAMPAIPDDPLPPARRGPSSSHSALPPVRRGSDGSSAPGPVDPFEATAVRGVQSSRAGMPPVRRGASDSRRALPPARRGAEESFGGMPPVRRGEEDLTTALPPTRGAQDSFGALPPVRRGQETRARSRGASDSFSALPPARRGASDSFDALPPVRRGAAAASRGDLPPVRRGAAADSFSGLPPARRETTRNRRGADPGFGGGARGAEDPFAALDEPLDRTPPVERRVDETVIDAVPPRHGKNGPTNGGRAARRRAEERLSNSMDPALSSMRLVPALPSMDDTFDRLPKHSRPDDDYLVRQRFGPEDSYDSMPAVERPVRSSGRRRHA
jgi:hypothetical protein